MVLTTQVFAEEEHAIYLSTLELTEGEGTLKLLVKVFEDDLRDALRNFHKKLIDTASVDFISEVEAYFLKHIQIKSQEGYVIASLSTIELVGDSYQVRFDLEKANEPSILEIEVSYFYELFPTQQNVLHLKIGDTQKYHIFKKNGQHKTFKLAQ